MHTQPYLGYGLGLRKEHYDTILSEQPAVDWFEILSENYMVAGGKPLYYLDRIRERYPLVMHGVSLSIGGTDPLNQDYLLRLKTLADRVKPAWISDHLCWTGVNDTNLHDLMPLPYTQETIRHVAERIPEAGERFLIDGLDVYVENATRRQIERVRIMRSAEAAGVGDSSPRQAADASPNEKR